jgi:hypothetical protein
MRTSRKFLLALVLFAVAAGPGLALAENTPAAQADVHAGHELQPPSAVEQPVDHAAHGAAATTNPTDQAGPAQPAPPRPGGHDGHAMGTMPGMEQMQQMDEALAARMNDLQTQMDAIAATKDPAERRRMLAAHLDALTQAIGLLREMDGKMMEGMMQNNTCPMMAMMSSPQGQAGMQGMMGHMPMCRSMMQKKAARQYVLLEQIVAAQKALLTSLP